MDKRQPVSAPTIDPMDASCDRCGVLFTGFTINELRRSRDEHRCSPTTVKDKLQQGITDLYPRLEGSLTLDEWFSQPKIKPCWKQLYDRKTPLDPLVRIGFRADAIRGGASDQAIHTYEQATDSNYLQPSLQIELENEREFGGFHYSCFDIQRRFPTLFLPFCTGCPMDPRVFVNPHEVLEIGANIEVWFTPDQCYRIPKSKLHEQVRFQEWCGDIRNQSFPPTDSNKQRFRLMVDIWRSRARKVDVEDLSEDRLALDQFLRKMQKVRVVTEQKSLADSDKDQPLAYHAQAVDELLILNTTVREMISKDVTFSRLAGLLKAEGLWAGKVKRTWIGKEKVALWRLRYSALWPHGPSLLMSPAASVAYNIFQALCGPNQPLDRDKAVLAEAGTAYTTRTVMVDDQVWVPVHHLWYRVKNEGSVTLTDVIREFHIQGWIAAEEAYEDVGVGPPVFVVKFKLIPYFDPSNVSIGGGEDSGGDPDTERRREKFRTWTPVRKDLVERLRGDQDPGNPAVLNALRALGADYPQGVPMAVLGDAVTLSTASLAPVLEHYSRTGEVYEIKDGEWRAI